MNFDQLTDEELAEIAGGPKSKPAPSTDLSKSMDLMSDDELAEIAGIPKPSAKPADEPGGALGALVKFGQTVDKYWGGPVRKGVSDLIDTGNPVEGVKGYLNQIGNDTSRVATGQDIARKVGVPDTSVSDVAPGFFADDKTPDKVSSRFGPIKRVDKKGGILDPSMSGAAGLAVDFLADPALIAPPLAMGTKAIAKLPGALKKSETIAGAADAAVKATRPTEMIADTAGAVGNGLAQAGKSTVAQLSNVFNPKRAADADELLAIATKNGIDTSLLPEAVEYGPSSVITRISRNLAEGPMGQSRLEKFQEGLAQVQQATDRQIAKVAGGYVPNEVEAGQLLRTGYDNSVDRLFQKADVTHGYVIQAAPGLLVDGKELAQINSKLAGIEKFAKGRAMRGITDTQRNQGIQLLRAIEAAKRGNGSYKQLYDALSDIGEVAFKSTNSLADTPVDIEKMQDLYFTIRDALVDTAGKRLGPDIKNRLVNSNKEISDFMKNKSVVSDVIGNKRLAPESVFKALVQNGDTRKIGALREMLSPAEFNQLKGTILETLIKRNPDGSFTFGTLRNAMRNKRNVLEAMFSPEELVEFGELIQLGERFGNPVMSSSGTGASNAFRDISEGVRNFVFNDSLLDTLKKRSNKLPGAQAPRPLEEVAKKGAKSSQVLSTQERARQKK